MSPDRPGAAQRTAGVPDEQVTSELVDLDASLGLAAFVPERPDQPSGDIEVESVEATPAPGPLAAAGPERTDIGDAGPAPVAKSGAALHHPSPAAEEAAGEWMPGRPVPAEAQVTSVERPMPPAAAEASALSASSRVRFLVGAAALAVILTAVGIWGQRRPSELGSTGELTVGSTPPGARVTVAGKDYGRTPVSLALVPGSYEVELRAGDERVVLPVQVKPGATTAQHVFLRSAPAKSAAAGRLHVTSEPPAAAVTVDGKRRGTTPLVVTALQPGPHDVVVTGTTGQVVRQRVQVDADSTTRVTVPLPKSAAGSSTGGWLTVTAPLELQISEGDRLVGTSAVSRLMLTTGTHTLRLTNEAAGVDLTRQVTIGSGRTARLEVTLRPGTLNVNAVPWAQVFVDGRDVGETPLGGIALTPGRHEVTFRHPDLGERRQEVTVRSGASTRLSLDLRR